MCEESTDGESTSLPLLGAECHVHAGTARCNLVNCLARNTTFPHSSDGLALGDQAPLGNRGFCSGPDHKAKIYVDMPVPDCTIAQRSRPIARQLLARGVSELCVAHRGDKEGYPQYTSNHRHQVIDRNRLYVDLGGPTRVSLPLEVSHPDGGLSELHLTRDSETRSHSSRDAF